MTRTQRETVLGVFTENEAVRLTGVSLRQLRYWDRTGFFHPSLGADSSVRFGRLYSFRDLVALKVLDRLRNEADVSLPHLRQVKEELAALSDDVWSATTLSVHDRRVAFVHPRTGTLQEVVSGQGLLAIAIEDAASDMENAVRQLRRRSDEDIGRIARTRGVVGNKPVVAGTRITVRSIKAFAAAGYDNAEIRRQYPALTEADVAAALAYRDAA